MIKPERKSKINVRIHNSSLQPNDTKFKMKREKKASAKMSMSAVKSRKFKQCLLLDLMFVKVLLVENFSIMKKKLVLQICIGTLYNVQ